MTNPVERVACALSLTGYVSDATRRKARRAIAAMREPTERMCDMALVTPDDYASGPNGTFIALTKPADVWRTMIDAALNQSGGTSPREKGG